MAHRCSNAVVASVTTADDDDIFSLCVDVVVVRQLGVQKGLGVELEGDYNHEKTLKVQTNLKEVHSEVDAGCLAVGNVEIPWPCGTSGNNNSITVSLDLLHVYGDPDICVCDKGL